MSKNKTPSLYEVVFAERDDEVRRLEAVRVEIEAELEAAMTEYSKICRIRSLRRPSKKKVTPLLLEGKHRKD